MPDRQRNFTFVGEFDRIAQQIDQDLFDAQAVAHHPIRYAFVIQVQRQTLALSPVSQHAHGFFCHLSGVEAVGLNVEFARVDFREVQDVIDHTKQMLT